MLRRAAVALSLAAFALPARAGPSRAEGAVETEEAFVEILGQPVRVGETIELPEGFIRVEEAGTEDEQVGSFSVVPARALTATASARPRDAAAAPALAPAPVRDVRITVGGSVPEPACRAERGAYLRELWRLSGIEVSDPAAVLEGLEGAGAGSRLGFGWFALATDPFRPLAFSSELRGRAEALARCVRAHEGARVAAAPR